MASVPNGIGVSVQNEHFHTMLCKLFLSVSALVLVSVTVNDPLQLMASENPTILLITENHKCDDAVAYQQIWVNLLFRVNEIRYFQL